MGLVLMAALFAGCMLGFLVTSIAGGVGFLMIIRNAKVRSHVWWTFGAVAVIALPICLAAVHLYPYDTVRPGSDYDVAVRNLFLQGLGYCASPGVAVLLASVATWMTPRKAAPKPPA